MESIRRNQRWTFPGLCGRVCAFMQVKLSAAGVRADGRQKRSAEWALAFWPGIWVLQFYNNSHRLRLHTWPECRAQLQDRLVLLSDPTAFGNICICILCAMCDAIIDTASRTICLLISVLRSVRAMRGLSPAGPSTTSTLLHISSETLHTGVRVRNRAFSRCLLISFSLQTDML